MSAGKERFAGQVAIVTGASRGIGLAIAQALVDEGARVVITGRNESPLAEAAERIGERMRYVVGAADNTEHQAATVDHALQHYGRLDLLVNNAAVNPVFGPLIDERDPAPLRKTLEVNVLAALGWTQAAWSATMRERGGSVLNIASVGGLAGQENLGIYNVSKAALIHLTRQLALEMAPTVRVNAIAPAVIKTRFAERLYEEREAELNELYPMQRLGEVDDISAAALHLLSPESAWVTGQTHVVDGGLLLRAGYIGAE